MLLNRALRGQKARQRFGQADATFVRFPSGRSLLVDAGGTVRGTFDVGARIVSPVLWGTGIRRLDYLALTHGDPDHVGGAASVIKDFRPREVWTGVPVPGAERLQELERMSHRIGAVWRVLRKGDRLLHAGVSVRLWHPPAPEWERREVRNDDSLVIELLYGRVSVVLPGDIGHPVEAELSQEIPPAPLRVLKVPHHGSRTSSSAEFIAALRPRVAVISAGRPNRFGHPAPDVVRRYQDAGADGAAHRRRSDLPVHRWIESLSGVARSFDTRRHYPSFIIRWSLRPHV